MGSSFIPETVKSRSLSDSGLRNLFVRPSVRVCVDAIARERTYRFSNVRCHMKGLWTRVCPRTRSFLCGLYRRRYRRKTIFRLTRASQYLVNGASCDKMSYNMIDRQCKNKFMFVYKIFCAAYISGVRDENIFRFFRLMLISRKRRELRQNVI